MTDVTKSQLHTLSELIRLTEYFNWNYKLLSSNASLSLRDIDTLIVPSVHNSVAPFCKGENHNNGGLSWNLNITLDWVLAHPDTPAELRNGTGWNWTYLTTQLSLCDILTHRNLPWSWNFVYTYHKYEDIDIVLQFPNYPWDWSDLSEHVNPVQIFDNPQLPWRNNRLSSNRAVRIAHILNHPGVKWDYGQLCTTMPLDDILAHPEVPWNIERHTWHLSMNNTLTTEYILGHIDWDWHWVFVIQNAGLDYVQMLSSDVDWSLPRFDTLYNAIADCHKADDHTLVLFVLRYIEKFKRMHSDQWHDLHRSGVIKLGDVIDHPELIYTYSALSRNPNLTVTYVYAHSTSGWDWHHLYGNRAFTMCDIAQLSKLRPVIYSCLLRNANLTYEYVYTHAARFKEYVRVLSSHTFDVEIQRRNFVHRLESAYTTRRTRQYLDPHIIPVLQNIVIEY